MLVERGAKVGKSSKAVWERCSLCICPSDAWSKLEPPGPWSMTHGLIKMKSVPASPWVLCSNRRPAAHRHLNDWHPGTQTFLELVNPKQCLSLCGLNKCQHDTERRWLLERDPGQRKHGRQVCTALCLRPPLTNKLCSLLVPERPAVRRKR